MMAPPPMKLEPNIVGRVGGLNYLTIMDTHKGHKGNKMLPEGLGICFLSKKSRKNMIEKYPQIISQCI